MVITSNVFKKLYPFESRYFQLPCSNTLHYIDEGSESSKETIILLHGNPSWSFLYRNLIKKLKDKYRVIAFDHIGCGFSSKPQKYNYTLKTHIQNFANFFQNLKIDKTHLIVHDWGGAIGLGWAVDNLAKVKSITIANSAAFTSKDIPKRIALCKIPYLGSFIVRRLNGFALPATFMTTQNKLAKQVKQGYLLPYNNFKNRIAISKFVEDIPLSTSHKSYETLFHIESKLHLLKKTPILFQWGMRDFCFHKTFLKKWLDFFPNAIVDKYEDAGHYVFEDEPYKTYDNILRFLENI